MAKVLIIEDDLAVSGMISDWLLHNHHQVEVANTGRDGETKLLFGKFDLIILDWQLPEMSGIELMRAFRDRGGQTPILMLTARKELLDKEQGFETGADDYLTKPFALKELGLRINALLRRPVALASKTMRIKDIVLDTSVHSVTKGGEEVHLHPKEYARLEFFLRHPNQIFSAEALLERVWPTESESTANALIVSMRRLRQKLDDPGDAESIITTIRGSGYTLKQSMESQKSD